MKNKSINLKAQLFYALFKKIPIAMRITLLLLFVLTFQLQAEQIYSQDAKISLDMKNATIEKVLQTIEEKSDYYFLYNSQLIDVDRKVSVRVRNAPISGILEELFKSENVEFEVRGSQIILSPKEMYSQITAVVSALQQQKRTLTGTVVDAAGVPIIGANIVEVGTTNGTVTDVDGKFSLNVDNNATIHISYIGYLDQEIPTTSRTSIDVVLMEDTQALDELVVVGYGVQKRASITGSVASIQSKDITTVKTPNVGNMLAGKLPGLRAVQRSGAPGDDNPSIDIRGFGSALVIVDGVERDFRQIDANDIESISVLKDASAAVYGFKGANGVLLVTTKKGVISKPKIEYNGYIGFQTITRYPELMNGYEYASLYNEANQNIGVNAPYSEEQLEAYKAGIGTTDWFDATIRGSIPQMYHNLSVTGGVERVKYFFSLGYTEQEGMYKSNDYTYDRYNVRSNIGVEIADGFTVDLQLSGRLDTRIKPYETDGIMRSIQIAKPINSIYANNNPAYWQSTGDKPNPVHISDIDNIGYDRRDRREFNGAMIFNWEIPWVKGLSAKALLAYDYRNAQDKDWYKELYEYNYDAVNDVYNKINIHTLSELTSRQENYFKPTQQYSLNYADTFGKHDLNALLLWEMYNDRTDWVQAYRQFTIGVIDQIDAGNAENKNNGGKARVSAHQGLVGRLNYAYDDRYLAELSFRYDGSYKFDPDKRWGFFPALSLGWRVSEEPFFKDFISDLDNLKIRGSYGKIGDEGDFAAYQYLSGYTYPSGSYVLGSGGLSLGARDKGMPNPNLTWYESTIANIGFETSAWKGLISAEFDYFIRKRDGLLATRQLTLPTTFGQSLPQENLNSDKNEGFEIILGHDHRIGNFRYNIKANFSTTRISNRYVERPSPANRYDNWRNNSNDRYKDINWGKVVMGQFQSYDEILSAPIQDGNGNKSLMPGDLRFQDWNNDGIIDGKDDQPIGHGSTPRMYYGLNLYGEYKGIDLTVFFQGAGGHEVFISGDVMDPFIQQGLGNGFKLFTDRWHREDSSDPSSIWIPGYMPALRPTGKDLNRSNNTWSMQKATYVRLKTVELGYTLPKNYVQKIGLNNLRIYFNCLNPLTFTSRTGMMKYMDPENGNTDLRYYPQMKTFNFGINLTI
jgi:TonB-linked SusC/RagA family outer membrane protein